MGEWYSVINAMLNPVWYTPQEIADELGIDADTVGEIGPRANGRPDRTASGTPLYTYDNVQSMKNILRKRAEGSGTPGVSTPATPKRESEWGIDGQSVPRNNSGLVILEDARNGKPVAISDLVPEAEVVQAATDAPEENKVVSIDDIRDAYDRAVRRSNGKPDAANELLEAVGNADSIDKIDVELYPFVLAALNRVEP